MRQLLLLAILYGIGSLIITGLWSNKAETEKRPSKRNSIIEIAKGSAPSPFVKRRLICEVALLLTRLTPEELQTRLIRTIDNNPLLSQIVHINLGWPSDQIPLLVFATFLICITVFGFMCATRVIILCEYDTAPWLANIAALIIGFGLLAGGGDGHYPLYPYDLPNAFFFSLTLVCILKDTWWLLGSFCIAAYSKETSLLLMFAYILLANKWLSWRFIVNLVLMSLIFAVARMWINYRFQAPDPDEYWFPLRNANILEQAAGCYWLFPLHVVLCIRFIRLWPAIPLSLRKLMVLCPILLGIAFFKGWLEELRQYTELLAILGPVAVQWACVELGFGHLFSAKKT